MSTAGVKCSRYGVQRVYIVICRTCNEDIGRPVTGEDPVTRADVDELIEDHERVFHPGD